MSASDWIGVVNAAAQFLVAGIAVWAVLASLHANSRQIEASDKQMKEQIRASDMQLKKQIEESRRLAIEDRRYQSCPIIAPRELIQDQITVQAPGNMYEGRLYGPMGVILWGLPALVPVKLCNMGGGPAFNIHCVFHGPTGKHQEQFISWDNGPIKSEGEYTVICTQPNHGELALDQDDMVDGANPLYVYDQLDSKAARLTITYHDLWGDMYVSIFDYTLDHQWERVFVRMPFDNKLLLDLRELNDQKKQQAVKYSAPVVKTSP